MSFGQVYDHAYQLIGACPIESGHLLKLADNECRHGRLPYDRSAPCGCFPEEGATIHALPAPAQPAADPARKAA
ncbi:hypothetical protein GKE82_23510 [Conexibacter sp. W3-3-2]|uniref:hypothetical protein n=1 Tax=Conexibacter sp. W3-3-2 TaxID=2675227 RepID=UPI0012B9170E|nr:hypothetical protein [Conexibacter sp. W3-3-2]MTD47173.1 hypothetical protein [Conexibacter sp. W3-3-2]